MNKAELSEIRALLQASTPVERRPRGPFLGAIRSLLPPPAPPARPSMPPPRRVGLRTAEPADIEAVEELLLSQPLAEEAASEARRRAFGQRHAAHVVPMLRLAAPLSPPIPADDPEVGEVLRRHSLKLARLTTPVDETPYHPEDLFDGGEAEQLYADAGLFEPHPPATANDDADADAERQLLRHLERVLVAELAALAPLPR